MGDDVESSEYSQLKFDLWVTRKKKKQEGSWISGVDKDDEITVFGSISCSLLRGFLLEERK